MEACKVDAFRNGWSEIFGIVDTNKSTLGSLLRQYKVECPPRGRGRKRAAFDYKIFFNLMPRSTCRNTTGMLPHFQKSSTRAGSVFNLFEYDEYITQLAKDRLFYDAMEAAKQWKEIQSLKTTAMSFPLDLENYISGAHINGVCKAGMQPLEFANQRCWGYEFQYSPIFVGHGRSNKKVARLSAGPRPRARGASRLCRVFVHCSVIVNSDAFRPSEENNMAAIEMLHNDLVKSCTEFTKRGTETRFFQVFLLRQKLLTLAYQDLDTSDPEPSTQS